MSRRASKRVVLDNVSHCPMLSVLPTSPIALAVNQNRPMASMQRAARKILKPRSRVTRNNSALIVVSAAPSNQARLFKPYGSAEIYANSLTSTVADFPPVASDALFRTSPNRWAQTDISS